MQRTKGHAWERQVAQDFQELGWSEARRLLEYNTRDANGIDLQDTFPFLVQCKRHKDYVSINHINEIQTGDDGAIPLLLTKADRKPTMAVLPWTELKKLIKQAYETEKVYDLLAVQ